MRVAIFTPALAILALLSMTLTMTGAGLAENATVTGTAGYRERIALPPGAVLEVRLLDVSRMDVAATPLSMQRYAMTGVPQAFSLAYDPALIDDRMRYVLRAEILRDGKVLFRTTRAYPVLGGDAGDSADLMLTRAGANTRATRLTGDWQVTELNGDAVGAEAAPVVGFPEAGGIALKGACNSFVGKAEPNGGNLAFSGPMAGTMMACTPEKERMDRDLVAAIEATDRFVRDGEALEFRDAEGVTVMRLRRVD